jgi:hypothetical protein
MERGVRRIGGALGVGDDAELHLDPVGHCGTLPVMLGRAGIIAWSFVGSRGDA